MRESEKCGEVRHAQCWRSCNAAVACNLGCNATASGGWLRRVICSVSLLLASNTCLAAAQFQSVLTLACAGSEFVIDARPFAENSAATSSLQMRYRYGDKILSAVRFEAFYRNLESLRLAQPPPTREFGLRLALDGASHTGGTVEAGDSLYLAPDIFTRAQFDALGTCIAANSADIRHQLQRAVITSKTLLGLMRTQARTGLDGIARLSYTESPVHDIYSGGWYFLLLRSDGQVWLHSNFTANNRAESVRLGSWSPATSDTAKISRNRRGKAVLSVPRSVLFQGEDFGLAQLKTLRNQANVSANDSLVWPF